MHQKLPKPTRLEEIIFGASIVAVFILTQLPYEKVDGNPVPIFIFKEKPSWFHAFVLALNFSFFGSVTTIALRERHPSIATFCLSLAVASVTTAVGIFLWLVMPMGLELVSMACFES